MVLHIAVVRINKAAIELSHVLTLAEMLDGLTDFNVLRLLRRIGYRHVCIFPNM